MQMVLEGPPTLGVSTYLKIEGRDGVVRCVDSRFSLSNDMRAVFLEHHLHFHEHVRRVEELQATQVLNVGELLGNSGDFGFLVPAVRLRSRDVLLGPVGQHDVGELIPFSASIRSSF